MFSKVKEFRVIGVKIVSREDCLLGSKLYGHPFERLWIFHPGFEFLVGQVSLGT